MSGSNRRLASSFRFGLGVLVALGVLGVHPAPSAAAVAPANARALRLELATDAAGDPALARFLDADRKWLATLPAGLPVSVGDTTPAAPGVDIGSLRLVLSRIRSGQPPEDREEATGLVGVVSLLRDRWLARGHLAAQIRLDGAEEGAPPRLVLSPGPLHRVGRVVVEGPDFKGRERLIARLLPRSGDPFLPGEWARAVRRLLAAAGEAGHPFARWVVRDVAVGASGAEVSIRAVLFTGPVAVVGPQTSSLPGGRGESFLIRAAGVPSGENFRESLIVRGRRRLLERGVYAAVGEPQVTTTAAPGTVGIHWPVTPIARPSRLSVALGLSRARAEEPARLSGQVDLKLANLAGTGRRLDLAWSDDGRDRSHFGFGWLEPLLAGTPLDAEALVDHEVRRDVYTRFRLDGRASLPVAGGWGVEVGLGWDRSTFPAGELTRTTRQRARGAFVHRRADPFRSGWAGAFAVESARRRADVREEFAGSSAGEEERQTLIELDVDGELWVGDAMSLAGRGSLRDVTGDAGTVPLSEQYRFGGTRSVRGYLEDQFHGERVTHGGVELRLGRPGGSRLYTFFDMGYFRFSAPVPEDPERLESRRDFVRGFGLGLLTGGAGGEISLAIGLPGRFDFDEAKLHVALQQTF